MMIEIMAGKSASIHGLVHDATPFRYSEEDTAVEYFGKLLEAGGYNYYGTERMYSGVTGTELQASIFMGVVHYQRLRHMVSDKWQVCIFISQTNFNFSKINNLQCIIIRNTKYYISTWNSKNIFLISR